MHMHVHYLLIVWTSCMLDPSVLLHLLHCLDTDEPWFMLINPLALICFWESTWTVLSYCLKNCRLVTISTLPCTDDEFTAKLCCWLICHDLSPLAIEVLIQILSPLLSPESSPRSSPESKVQVLYCPKLVQQPLSHRSASTLWEDSWAKLASQLHKWTLLIWIQIRFKNKPV